MGLRTVHLDERHVPLRPRHLDRQPPAAGGVGEGEARERRAVLAGGDALGLDAEHGGRAVEVGIGEGLGHRGRGRGEPESTAA